VAIITVLLAPMLFTSRAFWVDASNHLWLVLQQQRAFQASRWPTFFISSDRTGVASPLFSFYGGTGNAVVGAVSALLGGRTILADDLSWIYALVIAYVGFSWLSWQVGLRGAWVHAAGLVYVSSSYYLTDVYNRGDWGETMAISAFPLVVASAFWLLRAPRWRPVPVLALIVSTTTLTATHNITALWGATFLAILVVLLVVATWPASKAIPVRRVVGTVGVMVLASLVNAWYLLPDVAFAHRTALGSLPNPFVSGTRGTWFDNPSVIFNPLPSSATPNAHVQLPMVVIAWLLVAALLVGAALRRSERRLLVGLAVVATGFVGLLLFEAPWSALPQPYLFTQFAFRVTTYVLLCVCGMTILLLLVGRRSTGAKRASIAAGLIVALGFGLGLGVQQIWSADSALRDRHDALTRPGIAPASWYDQGSFADASAKLLAVVPGRRLTLNPALERGGRLTQVVDAPAGPEPIVTNIAGGTYFVDVGGVIPVGVTRVPQRLEVRGRETTAGIRSYSYPTDQFRMVVRRPPDHLIGPLRVTLAAASSFPIAAGRVLTLLSLVALLLVVVVVAVSSRRYGRTRHGTPGPSSRRDSTPDRGGDPPGGVRVARRRAGRDTAAPTPGGPGSSR
jgi:hypothetical protein